MNIKLLTFVILSYHLAHSSEVTAKLPSTTAQTFFQQFRTHFTTVEHAQVVFQEQPGDTDFIRKATTNMDMLTKLLAATTRLCKTDEEKIELKDLAKQLSSIAQEHERLIYWQRKSTQGQTPKLQRAHSAATISTTPRTLREQQYSSFRQLKPNNHELD